MNTIRVCPQCHRPVERDSPKGLCPICLAQQETRAPGKNPSEATTTAPRGPSLSPAPGEGSAPRVEELARHFPQLQILNLLGQGGMGVVYQARQPALDRIVALKVLWTGANDAAFAERFAQEARSLARLNHPNIVTVHDFGQAGPYYYFVMEFVDGANVRRMLTARHITPKEALAIVPSICDALQYAHEEGIVHRDIKPENILVDKKGRVKIADFGLAKLLGRSALEPRLTNPGIVMGTPHYMAPEQMERPMEVDHRADIYSLGVVFYEMLTGDLPLGRFAPPSEKASLDDRLDTIVLRTLENDPKRRYQHVSEMKQAMDAVTGMFENLPLHIRQAVGFEYKSKARLFGLPLVHLVHGVDLNTGKRKTARGILAIGDVAQGAIAFGGVAYGGLAIGGIGVGLISASGLSLALFASGGVAVGLIASFGGLAFAPLAFGGLAMGYMALGAIAFGVHANDQAALDIWKSFLNPWWWSLAFCVIIVPSLLSFLIPAWFKRIRRGNSR